jgi:hypothetical protein
MRRLDRINSIATRYSLTVAEYLVLHIATAFVMTPEQATTFLAKSLEKSSYTTTNATDPVKACYEKGWVGVTPAGMLVLTTSGMGVAHVIGAELTLQVA